MDRGTDQRRQPIQIHHWANETPVVNHETAIVWHLFHSKGAADRNEAQAPLEQIESATLHAMQPGPKEWVIA